GEELTDAARRPRRFGLAVGHRGPMQPGDRRAPTSLGRAAALLLALGSFPDVAWRSGLLDCDSARRAERRPWATRLHQGRNRRFRKPSPAHAAPSRFRP